MLNTNHKKAGAAILISDKVDFRASKLHRGKEMHCIKEQKVNLPDR